jgi:hypothetical protein
MTLIFLSYFHGYNKNEIFADYWDIMYSFFKRMRVGHDFLTHFKKYSKIDNMYEGNNQQ